MRKSYRVKKEAEFQKVFTQGKSCANKQFVVYMIEKPKQPHFRVGISVGKKIGNAYFVYTAPTGNCAPNEVAAQTARNTAAKAIYDALEAVPTATTSSSTANSATQSNN